MKTRAFPPLNILFAMSAFLPLATDAAYPPSEKKPVTDEYHGDKIVDEYRWLEDGDSRAVKSSFTVMTPATRCISSRWGISRSRS